uniref:Bacterial Ig domain-containing protein n=1 Tax=Phenylobacterium glaciei TaxID=2803784 RepID=A0A974SAJ1_9CAUL|nr:hypothetical protein JKL49_13355 [Phenylobacterium glaciei]
MCCSLRRTWPISCGPGPGRSASARWPRRPSPRSISTGRAAVVSGVAQAGTAITVRADGRQSADGRASAEGRFAISLTQPLSPGVHTIKIFNDGAENSATIDTSPAAPLAEGPFEAAARPQVCGWTG